MITTEPEQIFLAKHHDALSKARDPRDILTRQPQGPEPGGVTSYGTGVVGPMQSSTFSGYHVDKVIRELEGEDVASKIAKMTGGTAAAAAAPPRRVRPSPYYNYDKHSPILETQEPSRTASANAPSALNQSANMSSPAPAPRIATPSSPPAAGATSGQPQPSHEVLHNFFQSLLTARGAANTAAAPPNAAANPPAADQGQ